MGVEWGSNRVPVRCRFAPLQGDSALRTWFFVFPSQRARVDQPQQHRLAVAALAVVEELVLALVAAARAVGHHVFELHEPRQLAAQRTICPAERFTQLALREAELRARRFFGQVPLLEVIVREHQ